METTLEAIASALRHGTPLESDLPDLRAAHNEILQAHIAPSERYALVNIETDRIVTTLNTVREQVARLRSPTIFAGCTAGN